MRSILGILTTIFTLTIFSSIFSGGLIFAKQAPLIDFGNIANYPTSSFKDPETDKVSQLIVAGDFDLGKWKILLSSSSRTVKNMEFSYTKKVDSKTKGTVLGVRVRFPTSRFNSHARILPPHPIQVWSGETGEENEGLGIIRNAKIIRRVEIQAYGRNFKNKLTLFVSDRDGKTYTIAMGNLYHSGWKTMIWDNPNYIKNIRNRNLVRTSLYPNDLPYYKYESIMLSRHMDHPGGDFVTYIKDVQLTFDRAVDPNVVEDIKDEDVWKIIYERGQIIRRNESTTLKEYNYKRDLELLNMGESKKAESSKPAGGATPAGGGAGGQQDGFGN